MDQHESSTKKQLATNDWGGYTFDELRYHRALNTIRIEIEKEKLQSSVQSLNPLNIVSGGGLGIARSLFGNMDKLGYAILAFKAGQKLFKLYKRLKH